MAIAPTGAIYKSLIFDGENSRNYGIYITGQAVYNAPERDVEMISIHGRNGDFALDKGRFNNIEVTYPAGIFADTESDFAEAISGFRNFLCSRKGYVRLSDEYNPNEYRMVVYKSGLEVSPTQLKAGEFNIVFDCKPQRYLLSGEEPITIGEWHETETASGEIASFEAVDGDAVKSLIADIEPIQDLHGYDKPWSGGAGKNKFPNSAVETQTQAGITIKSLGDGQYTINGTETSGYTNVFAFDLVQTVVATNTQKLVLGGSWVGTISFLNANGGRIDYWSKGNSSVRVVTSLDNLVGASVSKVRFDIAPNSTHNNETAFVMLVDTSVTDTTFEPYSNICPISGYDSVVVSRTQVNVWDEEYRLGNYDISNGIFVSESTHIANKNPIPIVPNKQYYFNTNGYNINVCYMDANMNFVRNFNSVHDVVDTSPSNARYILFNMAVAYGTTYNHDISINYPSTDHEYHAYNGNTYTIDLNGTRYGGTLDVASGVLMVDRVAVDMGSLTWEVWPGYTSIFRCGLPSGCKTVGNQGVPNWLCSAYVVTSGVSVSSTVGAIGQLHASYVLANNPSYTDASAFKTAMTGQTLVYELATPQTVQLTAQEVELLVGLNQVWANSGDVSVEYGTAPNVVYNPTLFESSPMLEVEGYGTININDEVVSIQDEVIGTIQLTQEKREEKNLSSSITCTLKLPTGSYQAGDEIYSTAREIFLFDARTRAITGYSDPVGVIATQYIPSGDFVITAGTTKQGTETGSGTNPVFRQNTWVGDYTLTENMEFSYDGIDTITVTNNITISGAAAQYVEPSWLRIRIQPLTVDSTKPVVDGTIFIDLDIGEAWVVDSGEISPANNVVAIPAELPKLKSGVNTITHDNSIDSLKVTPRWWKL